LHAQFQEVKRRFKKKKHHKKKQKVNVFGTKYKVQPNEVSKYNQLFRQFNATFIPNTVAEETIVKGFCKLENVEQDAFFIVDLGKIVKQYIQWQKLLPRVVPFYAVKCNPSDAMLKTLKYCGANFDCASKQEIEAVVNLGVDPKTQIIFANPCKQLSHIRYAKELGVSMVTVDNEAELYKHRAHWPEVGIIIRISVDDSNSLCKFSSKFGASLDKVPRLISVAKDLGLKLIGVSFHVGSGCYSVKSYQSALKDAKSVFDLAEKEGFKFTILDIGGGFPGSNNANPSFPDIANVIRDTIDELFPKEVKVIAEPGRYFAHSSHILACNVFSKRKNDVKPDSDDPEFLYYINDGLYGSFNCLIFDHVQINIKPVLENKNAKKYKSTIFGPTCDSLDKVAEKVEIQELEIGDWVYVSDFGAYTVAAATTFNGFKTVKTHYIWTN
jgi:ornithine decarboxylase